MPRKATSTKYRRWKLQWFDSSVNAKKSHATKSLALIPASTIVTKIKDRAEDTYANTICYKETGGPTASSKGRTRKRLASCGPPATHQTRHIMWHVYISPLANFCISPSQSQGETTTTPHTPAACFTRMQLKKTCVVEPLDKWLHTHTHTQAITWAHNGPLCIHGYINHNTSSSCTLHKYVAWGALRRIQDRYIDHDPWWAYHAKGLHQVFSHYLAMPAPVMLLGRSCCNCLNKDRQTRTKDNT